jgi:hypothetical protein
MFAAIGASPSSGTITIDFSGQSQNSITYIVDQLAGVDNASVSTTVVQSATNFNNSTNTSLTVTLGAFKNSLNATYGFLGRNANQAVSTGSNFTMLAQTSGSTYSQSEFANNNQTSVNWTFSSSNQAMEAIAIEVKAKNVFMGSMI